MTSALKLRPTSVFLASAVAVFAIELLIVRSAHYAARPDVFAPAVAFDLAVFVPALYWLLVLRVGAGSWLAFFGILTIAWGAAPFVLPAPQRHYLAVLLVAGPIAEAVSLGYAAVRIRRIVRAYRAWSGDPADVLVRLRHALVEGMGASVLWRAVSDELSMWRYALKPPSASASPGAFTYHRKSAWGALVLAIAIVGVAETAGVHLLVSLWSVRVAWLLTFSSFYALMWLLGDVRACRRRPLVVDGDGVLVRTGLRWTVRVPWEALAEVSPVRGGMAPPKRAQGYLRATAFGDPTLLLELTRDVTADGPYGIHRTVRRIGVAPDDVAAFTAAVEAHRAQPTA